ncbi:MAG TPA: excinuclease ABC subunit UvrC [Dehalococcoidia bacterium]|nr:excinuclease ABC subunit UvrC [Dehalococcoidia bacterium]
MEARRFDEQLKALPQKTGVYLFKDTSGNVIYVGKATNLYCRIRSYFGTPHALSSKIQWMVARVSSFEFFITDSEQEALILECNLIKKHHPRYNVRLKDDKTYPYLKINIQDDWARVYVTRRVDEDGNRYFGPFASAGSVRKTLDLLQRLFPFRSCKRAISGTDRRPCLEYDMHRCAGPCIGAISREEYHEIINEVVMFLEGKQESVVKELRRRMAGASERLDFERAAVLRDQIRAVEMVTERQKISSTDRRDQDVIALAKSGDQAYLEVFFIRGGRLIERDHFMVQGAKDEEPGRIMAGFLNQFYHSATYVPPVIMLQHRPDDILLLQRWLASKRGQNRTRVSLVVPQRGEKRKLVDMVAENARQGLEQLRVKQLAEPGANAAAIEKLGDALRLPRTPSRVECYDISDIRGTSAVGSMVVFQEGRPVKAHYRRFRIKTVGGADDYAMIKEVLRRRFKRAEGFKNTDTSGWTIVPDLVLIDGGKGHLNAAGEAIREMGVEFIPVASIAKENEELFRPGIADPIILHPTSSALYLVQRIRDEAHRFAIGYHRRVRRSETMASALDNVPGIGPKRKRALLQKFGSVRAIKEAPIDEMAAVVGMTQSLAQRVKESL